MLVNCRATPSMFTSTHLYTWMERGTVRVKCLAQEHNTMSWGRAQTRTPCSGEVIVPPHLWSIEPKRKYESRSVCWSTDLKFCLMHNSSKCVVLELLLLRGEKSFKPCPRNRILGALRVLFKIYSNHLNLFTQESFFPVRYMNHANFWG